MGRIMTSVPYRQIPFPPLIPMNSSLALLEAPSRAHPLFPVDQAILWLPGIPGHGDPYCSYNEMASPAAASERETIREKTIPFAPRHPVSQGTFVSWDLSSSPPLPFHPVPISRALTAREMRDLATRVGRMAGDDQPTTPGKVLHNARKGLVYCALLEMGVPASFIPQVI